MATDSEIEFFSITPLHEHAGDAEGGQLVPARARPLTTLAQVGAWLIAAALAVAASFAPLYRIHGQLPNESPLPGDPAGSKFSFYVDGWGRPRLHDTGPLSVDDTLNGPRYGLGFCACAALMVLAAVLTIAGPRLLAALRPRWRARSAQRLASTVGIAAALLLTGSAGSAALSMLPIRTQVHALRYETFGFGWSLGLAGLSSVVCVLVWGWAAGWARRWDRLAPADAASPADPPAETQDGLDLAGKDRPAGKKSLSATGGGRPEPPEPDLSAWRPPVDRLQ